MLERASLCLEPVAQNLFRSIEAPTRSQRRLPQAFWHRTRLTQEQISWWPAYLDDIRRAAQAREEALNNGSSTSPRVIGELPFAPKHWITAESHTASTIGSRRHISKVVKQSRVREEKEFQDALKVKDETAQPVDVEIFGPEDISELRDIQPDAEKTPSERLEELLRAGGEPRYNAVYLAFVSLKEPARLARAVLRYLSRSPSTVVLRRALRIFQIIEVEDRTHLTYESAIRAAVGLRKYGTANTFVLEALERGMGLESSQFLMGHLVEKGMWKSTVRALQVFTEHMETVRNEGINDHVALNIKEAPIWKTVDGMLALPRSLITLCARLKDGDAVLAINRPDIEYLATRLLERALRSTTIMAVITPEGVLALFDSYRGLGLLHREHYLDALSALHRLREFRNRSQLALLIFRNMRWHYPNFRFRYSTYGTMISILSAAPNEAEAFDYILKDARAVPPYVRAAPSERKPDLAMYQRVMSACAEQGLTTYVKVLLQELIGDHGVPRDLAYFTPVLLSSAKRGDISETRRSFNELSSKYDLKPNIHSWNILLLAYARADDFKGAAALFRYMQYLNIPADSYTFGTLMSMYSNAGDTQAVLQLVNMAREKQIPASTPMIDTIVHTYCLNGEVNEAESLVEAVTQMSLAGKPTRMWNILLRHYAFRGDSASVLRTQERMRELAVKPDGMTYAALMTSLVVMGKTQDAAAVLRSLHLSQVVTASRFHYSIVVHGYVQEGNRAMAMIIYTEMLERFPRPSPSARLAIMHLQSKRDDEQTQTKQAAAAIEWDGKRWLPAAPLQNHPIEFLADALLEMADTEGLPSEPQPGFRQRRPTLVTPEIYLEVSLAILNREASYEKAQELLSRYEAIMDASAIGKQQKAYQSVQILTAYMRGVIRSWQGSGRSTAHLRPHSQRQLDAIWTRILTQTISTAKEQHLGLLQSSVNKQSDSAPPSQPPMDRPYEEESGLDPASVAKPMKPFDNDVSQMAPHHPFDILPAKRYALSVPLSVYMRGLALQSRFAELNRLVQQVQEMGFELTSRNWNTYIQVLSEKEDHILQAFSIFEQKFLPNLPPWALLKRGLVWFSPEDQPSSEETESTELEKSPVSRLQIEKLYPGQLMPTYFTVVHLAAAFIKAYHKKLVEEGDGASLYGDIRRHAPGTAKFIQDMPHLKDRVQGVLIRGRAVKGDFLKRAREPKLANRAGLLGSQSILNGISPEQIEVWEKSKGTKEDLHALSEELEGPILRNPLIKRGQAENPQAYKQHIRSQVRNQYAHIQQLQTELQDKGVVMMADDAHGEPHIDGLPAEKETISRPDSLFKQRVKRLFAVAKIPEIQYPRWKFRSRLFQTPRIKTYPSKKPMQLLRPMGNYMHKSLRFTKPMLPQRIPKRRMISGERMAFRRWKAFKDLQKGREHEARRAQARERRMRRREKAREQERMTDEHNWPVDDASFLEARLVSQEPQSQPRDPSPGDKVTWQPVTVDHERHQGIFLPEETEVVDREAPSPESRRSAKTDLAALRAMVDEDRKARKRPIRDVDLVKEVDDDVEFLEARVVGPARRQNQAGTPPDQASTQTPERVDMPFGPVEGFGDFDFVLTTPRREKNPSSEEVGR
jgi:pentatricopeptide repeat-containing protein PET309